MNIEEHLTRLETIGINHTYGYEFTENYIALYSTSRLELKLLQSLKDNGYSLVSNGPIPNGTTVWLEIIK